jgi:hypothetical protein
MLAKVTTRLGGRVLRTKPVSLNVHVKMGIIVSKGAKLDVPPADTVLHGNSPRLNAPENVRQAIFALQAQTVAPRKSAAMRRASGLRVTTLQRALSRVLAEVVSGDVSILMIKSLPKDGQSKWKIMVMVGGPSIISRMNGYQTVNQDIITTTKVSTIDRG